MAECEACQEAGIAVVGGRWLRLLAASRSDGVGALAAAIATLKPWWSQKIKAAVTAVMSIMIGVVQELRGRCIVEICRIELIGDFLRVAVGTGLPSARCGARCLQRFGADLGRGVEGVEIVRGILRQLEGMIGSSGGESEDMPLLKQGGEAEGGWALAAVRADGVEVAPPGGEEERLVQEVLGPGLWACADEDARRGLRCLGALPEHSLLVSVQPSVFPVPGWGWEFPVFGLERQAEIDVARFWASEKHVSGLDEDAIVRVVTAMLPGRERVHAVRAIRAARAALGPSLATGVVPKPALDIERTRRGGWVCREWARGIRQLLPPGVMEKPVEKIGKRRRMDVRLRFCRGDERAGSAAKSPGCGESWRVTLWGNMASDKVVVVVEDGTATDVRLRVNSLVPFSGERPCMGAR